MAFHKATYQCYQDMKSRCLNPNSQQYKNYGARGISVCARWLESYQNFLDDMGQKPDGLTIDRKDNDGNYEPGNCAWATKKEQRLNQRTCVYLEFDGLRLTQREWAQRLGMPEQTLYGRIKRRGWSVERSLTTPVDSVFSLHGKNGCAVRHHAAIASLTETADGEKT